MSAVPVAAPAITALDHEAIAWEAQLRSGDIDTEALQAFEAWRDQSPAHQASWDALQRRLARWSGAGPAAAAALRTEGTDRRRLLRGGFQIAVLGLTGLGARQAWHYSGADADLASAIGERRAVALDDGNSLTLDADSRIYRSGSAGAPTFELDRGQLLLQVAANRRGPVGVAIGETRLSTHGAVLNVGRFAQRSVVALHSGTAMLTPPGRAPLALSGGDTVYLDGADIAHSDQSFASVTAWQRGLFVADRLPLTHLVSVFNRYHRGIIRAAGTVEALQISGVFRLDDLQQALAQVAGSLPVKVHGYGAWLIVLS